MRRALFLLIPTIALAACGSSESSSSTTATTEATAATGDSQDSPSSTSVATDGSAPSTSSAVTYPEPTTPPLESTAIPASCEQRTPATTLAPLPDPVDKPDIELPDPAPTELKTTDLETGEGPKAAAGDSVSVYYVGVLSKDGTEFDSNFGSGAPFELQLGSGMVIQGWDEGLVGVQAGTVRQLDIPADLAYGETGSGEVIGPNEPLTFIVDVVAVGDAPPAPPTNTPEDQPEFEFPTVEPGADFTTDDIVEGDECLIAQPGDDVFVNAITVDGSTGNVLDNSYQNGSAYQVKLDGNTVYGFAKGIVGMGVGGERLITMPPSHAFGQQGNVSQGLDPDTVILVFVKLEAIVGVSEIEGTTTTAPAADDPTATGADETATSEAATTVPATTEG